MSRPHELTALEQGALVACGELSARELTEYYLSRIEASNKEIGAYITVCGEQALTQADAADAIVRAGNQRLGPLHGVPVPLKDSVHVAGVRTTHGSLAFAEYVPEYDDPVVRCLRGSNSPILGKTNLSEFELSNHGENHVAPPTRTPWDLSRSSGGSSGGAAAAVAAGLAPVAHGSDSAGSVRSPASCCGLVGFKPSRGVMPPGPRPDVSGLTTHGVLARTVADAAALHDVMAGTGSALARTRNEHGPGALRIGLIERAAVPGVEIDPECARAVRETAALLEGLGHHLEHAELIQDGALGRAFTVVWPVMTCLQELPADSEELLLPLTRHLRGQGAAVSGREFARALGEFSAITERTSRLFGRFDVVLSPTLSRPPFLVGELRDDSDPARESAMMVAFSPFTCLYNITGRPAVSLPLHWTGGGLPVGVMLAGRRGEDDLLFSLASQLERARPWAHRRPSLTTATTSHNVHIETDHKAAIGGEQHAN